MFATRELLRAMGLGEIEGKAFVIQVRPLLRTVNYPLQGCCLDDKARAGEEMQGSPGISHGRDTIAEVCLARLSGSNPGLMHHL